MAIKLPTLNLLLIRLFDFICHMQVHSSRKLHPCGDVTSKTYKPAFYGGYLSHNMSYGGVATLQVFHLS